MTRIVTDPNHRFRLLARSLEHVWLQRHLGWRITAPANDDRPDWSPIPA